MKKLFGLVLFFVFIGAAAPPLAYWLGLQNMHGQPVVQTVPYTGVEAARVWLERKEALPVRLRPITPWHWYELLWCSRYDERPEDFLTCGDRYPGLRASGFVAKEHLIENMKESGLLWRYLSRTALTIWITRHWNDRELVSELIRLRALGR